MPDDPRPYALGVGLASAAGPDELATLVDEVLRAADVAPDQVRTVGTVDIRSGHPALAALAWPIVTYPPAALAAAAPGTAVTPPAALAAAAPGTGTAAGPPARPPVAEPAALLAAGPGSRLVVPKRRSPHATAALAIAR